MHTVRMFTSTLATIGACIIVLVLMFAMGPAIESKYFPVTADVKVGLIKVDDDKMYFRAVGNKLRHCSMLDVRILVTQVEGEPPVKGSIYVLDDGVGPRTRALGFQNLGIWVIEPAGISLDVDATYTCHPLWLTHTHLGNWPKQSL